MSAKWSDIAGAGLSGSDDVDLDYPNHKVSEATRPIIKTFQLFRGYISRYVFSFFSFFFPHRNGSNCLDFFHIEKAPMALISNFLVSSVIFVSILVNKEPKRLVKIEKG